jgi:YD repeat-containing protein
MKTLKCARSTLITLSWLALLLAAIANACAETFTYVYDDAGRLTEINSSNGRTIRYVYDLNGNLLQELVIANPDADGDGMDDVWEGNTFGDTSRNGSGDWDNDGQTDLAEYLAGTDPKNPASRLVVDRQPTANGVTATVSWSAVAGKKYRVQYKDSVTAAWSYLAGDVTATGPKASKVDDTIVGQPKRFYRVVVAP